MLSPKAVEGTFWARAITVELVRLSLSANTFPIILRASCDPTIIGRSLGLQPAHVSQAMKAAISGQLVTVVGAGEGLDLSPFFDPAVIAAVAVAAKMKRPRRRVTPARDSERKGAAKSDACPPEPDILVLRSEDQSLQSDDLPVRSDRSIRSDGSDLPGFQAGRLLADDLKDLTGPTINTRPRGRPPTSPSEDEVTVFQRWRVGLTKSTKTLLDSNRLRAIRRAMTPRPKGFGLDLATVLMSIDGWCAYCRADPWRMENMNRHELALFLRDASHIEQGLEHHRDYCGAAGPITPSGTAVDEATREAMARRAAARR